jgi:hypothetical protein
VAIPGLVLSYWSALLYIPMGRAALADGRADRAAATGVAVDDRLGPTR